MSASPPSDGDLVPETYHRGRKPRKRLLAALAAVTAVWAFVRWRPFRVEIRGPSMRPTLEPGDWALAVAPRRIRRGAVVVVEHPERPGFEMVKRVVGMAGDLTPDGRVLGPDELWVEGDNLGASTDSRGFGPVRREHVKAELRLIWWPPARRRVL